MYISLSQLHNVSVCKTLITCLFANNRKRYMQRIFFLTFSFWLMNKADMNSGIFVAQHLRLISAVSK